MQLYMILDCHTHKNPPAPDAIISASPFDFNPLGVQKWSVGIHPWHLHQFSNPDLHLRDEVWENLVAVASLPCVVAIGECGIDITRGGLIAAQVLAFQRQALLAEQLHKPLIIHAVKAHDMVVELKRSISPSQPWIIHGFRNRPSIAEIYLNADCFLSFGENFNPESLCITPSQRMLAETDDSDLPISAIIDRLEIAAQRDLKENIIINGKIFK